jgi:Zn-dependent M28 family amino/carboxypeptidase
MDATAAGTSVVVAWDAANSAVTVEAGFADVAFLDAASGAEVARATLNAAAGSVAATWDAAASTFAMAAGTANVALLDAAGVACATVALAEGDGLTFDQSTCTVTALSTNAEPLTVYFEDELVVLNPGKSMSLAGVEEDEHLPCDVRVNNTTRKLLDCVTLEGVREHQAAFQKIADANGGLRTSGTPGYDASVAYVVRRMTAAGYAVSVQRFTFPFFEETAAPELEQISPVSTDYEEETHFLTMLYSGSGDVTATVEGVDLVDLVDCAPSHFDGFTAGNIALVQVLIPEPEPPEIATCTFADIARHAEDAGAVGVIIYDPDITGAFLGTLLASGVSIPVVGTSFIVGEDLNDSTPTMVHMKVETIVETRTTANVLAETPGGSADNVVMAGAHLDSVTTGPGIQDNGSGSAALLEIAEQMDKVDPVNKVRFAWWGAEEFGLLGSALWVREACPDPESNCDELNNVALYLNFDMIGSPNFVRFVYDAETDPPQPPGSEVIEQLWRDYFADQALPVEEVEIGGRSDHFAFAFYGVPVGGLFTGAEVLKTPAQAAIYGGAVGEPYDLCYHLACDTYDNISLEALDQMSDAAAFAILTYAMNTEAVNGVSGKGNFQPAQGQSPTHRGNSLVR